MKDVYDISVVLFDLEKQGIYVGKLIPIEELNLFKLSMLEERELDSWRQSDEKRKGTIY